LGRSLRTSSVREQWHVLHLAYGTAGKVLRIWAREWFREGGKIDHSKLPSRPGFERLPRRWSAERTFAWISHNRRMAKDYERLCSTGEVFIHATIIRLMARRLAHA
jgi:transposase